MHASFDEEKISAFFLDILCDSSLFCKSKTLGQGLNQALNSSYSAGEIPNNTLNEISFSPGQASHWASVHQVELLFYHQLYKKFGNNFTQGNSNVALCYFPKNEVNLSKYITNRVLSLSARCMHLHTQTEKILELLASYKLSGIPLKGTVLSYLLYGSISLRDPGDIDILVPSDQYNRARKILLEQGWKEKRAKGREHEFHGVFQKESIILELHDRFTLKQFCFDWYTPKIWECSSTLYINSKPIQIFKAEHNFIYMMVHLDASLSPRGLRVKWLCDLARFIKIHPELDWEYIYRVFIQYKRKRFFWFIMLVLEKYFQCPRPQKLTQLENALDQCAHIVNYFHPVFPDQKTPWLEYHRLLLNLRLRESLFHKARLISGYVF